MTAVEQFQAATEQLANDTQQAALTYYGQYQTGQLDHTDTALMLAALINRANASAVSLADVWLAVQIEELTGEPVPTVGVLPVDESERLAKAVSTVLSGEGDFAGVHKIAGQDQFVDAAKKVSDQSGDVAKRDTPAGDDLPDAAKMAGQDNFTDAGKETNTPDMRLERLARGEVFGAAQQATHEAIQQQPLVEGWVRQMDADPCQLCKWWWREGRIWPKAHPMPRHTGCNCQQKAVVAQSIKPTQYTRNLERNT